MTDRNDLTFPAGFVNRMYNQLATEADVFFRALAEDPPVSVRINPAKWNLPLPVAKVSWSDHGFYLPERPSFTLDPFLHSGAYYVQEAGSMLLEQAFRAVNSQEPLVILDLCGAPGGKSTHLLTLMGENDLLVTNEVIRSRAVILQENIQKWGASNVVVCNSDPAHFSGLGPAFDIIVVDAPCSGEGLFRKDPSAIFEWSENNARLCASRQRRILADVWPSLKPGGYLIYSTCTWNPAENEENLQWLAEQYDAIPVEWDLDPTWNLKKLKFNEITGYQAFPHRAGTEGFFIGIAKQKEDAASPKIRAKGLKQWMPAPSGKSQLLKTWIRDAESADFLAREDEYHFFPSVWHSYLSLLEKHLKVIQAGIPVATAKGSALNPLPPLALANRLNNTLWPVADLSLEEAIRYLQRENLNPKMAETGWQLVSYRELPLGWQKNLGNRTNNYFPAEWRIRMRVSDIPKPWHERPEAGIFPHQT